MRARLSLVCSLLWLAACGDDRVIGNAEPIATDGGLTGRQADDLLAQYARDLEGEWQGMSPDRGATFTVTFTHSEELLRSGSVHSVLQLDCNFAPAAAFWLPFPPCDGREQFPKPDTWDAEYWLLKLQGNDAIVSMLPDRTQAEGFSFTCLYVPNPAPGQLKCGVTVLGSPLIATTLTRHSSSH